MVVLPGVFYKAARGVNAHGVAGSGKTCLANVFCQAMRKMQSFFYDA